MTGLICLCLLFALAAVGIGVAGLLGVRSATATASNISTDEVATATATAKAIGAIDFAYVTGQRLAGNLDPATRAELTTAQFDQTIASADASVIALVALHAGDGMAELAEIDQFTLQWAALRRLLISTVSATQRSQRTLSNALATASAPLNATLDQLVTREAVDTGLGRTRAAQTMRTTMWIVGSAMTLVVVAAIGMAWVGIRRVRRALAPEEDQSDFADTMQLAANEEEAHHLLKRHLERASRVAPSPYSAATTAPIGWKRPPTSPPTPAC